MTSPENCLVLSLAHRSLNADLLSGLLDRSASTIVQLVHEPEATKANHSISGSPKSTIRNNTISGEPLPHPILHVHVSGSSCIPTPGRSHTDWQTKWSEGEWIFSWLVDKIGIEHFHSTPKPGQPRLSGRLVDVNLSAFSNTASQREKIMKELAWIAINTSKHFALKSNKRIAKAVLLCPFGEEEEGLEGGMDEFVMIVRHVFNLEWTEKDGPFNGVEVEVEIVSVPEEEPSLELKSKRLCTFDTRSFSSDAMIE